MDTNQIQAIQWLANGEVGESSRCIAMWLAFGTKVDGARYSIPHDPDDMDRCIKLLCCVPGLRPLLPQMAELGPGWTAMVAHWDEIEALQMEEIGIGWTKARRAPKTYERMKQVIKGIPVHEVPSDD